MCEKDRRLSRSMMASGGLSIPSETVSMLPYRVSDFVCLPPASSKLVLLTSCLIFCWTSSIARFNLLKAAETSPSSSPVEYSLALVPFVLIDCLDLATAEGD